MLRGYAAPEPPLGCATLDAPDYLRIAKTGSTTALEFIKRTDCVRHGHLARAYTHHGDIPRDRMQRGKPTVVVMRDPCERARSTLNWWRSITTRDHPVHNLSSLAELAAYVGTLPRTMPRIWSGADYHRLYALVWEQARYINRCTHVICFDEGGGLERALQKLCRTSQPLRQLNLGSGNASAAPAPSSHVTPSRQQGREGDAADCKPIRQLYRGDELLWQAHCRGKHAAADTVAAHAAADTVAAHAPSPGLLPAVRVDVVPRQDRVAAVAAEARRRARRDLLRRELARTAAPKSAVAVANCVGTSLEGAAARPRPPPSPCAQHARRSAVDARCTIRYRCTTRV